MTTSIEGDPVTEPTEPRTHRTTPIGLPPAVVLPDDWPTGPVVVSTVPPDGLWPGPVVDGVQTYFSRGRSVPLGWHWRWRDDSDWFDVPMYSSHKQRFIQCRPVPAPEPATERVEAFDAIAQRRKMERDGVIHTADKLTRNRSSLSGVSMWSRDDVWLADPDEDGMVSVLCDADPIDTGRWEAAVKHAVEVLCERAPSDIDIDAGTDDAPWWLSLRYAIDRLDDVHRALVHRDRPQPTADHEGVTYTPELGGDQRVDDDGMVTVLRDAGPIPTDTPSGPKAEAAHIVRPPGCVCVAFGDTGGFRIADLACPVHGVEGTGPGDGPWETHRTDQLTDLEDDDA